MNEALQHTDFRGKIESLNPIRHRKMLSLSIVNVDDKIFNLSLHERPTGTGVGTGAAAYTHIVSFSSSTKTAAVLIKDGISWKTTETWNLIPTMVKHLASSLRHVIDDFTLDDMFHEDSVVEFIKFQINELGLAYAHGSIKTVNHDDIDDLSIAILHTL